jgi:hypothetical protein
MPGGEVVAADSIRDRTRGFAPRIRSKASDI